MGHDFTRLIDDGLRAFWERHPVTATFAGETQFDSALPRADAAAERDDGAVFAALAGRLREIAVPDDAGARLDARHLAALCASAQAPYARRARYRNPAWYTGEAAFAIVSLLLRPPAAEVEAALQARVRALPAFLDDGRERLRDAAIPAAWTARAAGELRAIVRLLTTGLPQHAAGRAVGADDLAAVTAACAAFAAAIGQAPDADAACGPEHLALIIEQVHGLRETAAELERDAAAAFAATQEELEAHARRLDPSRTWRETLAELGRTGPASGDVVATYAYWHERALADANGLLTPAADYTLTFAPLPAWAAAVAGDLYFLFYRSPPARNAGNGSTYWVTPPAGTPAQIASAHNTAAVKLVHAVHHGSIGHHTQNARARTAASRFARIAGTDGPSAIALLAGGTLVEGWACYAEDLLAEIPDFYTPAERLQLVYFELRNIAGMLADIRFHTGAYSLDEMRAFYRDEVGFAPTRVAPETTRNSMFPGSRVMYWSGSRRIKELRRSSALTTKAFHDRLLSFGAAPVAWIAEELAR